MNDTQPPADVTVGGVYAIRESLVRWGVVKVLKLEDGVVHLRYYRNKTWFKPTAKVADRLTLGSIDDKRGFGIGHMPMSESQFHLWHAERLFVEDVSEDELEGYRHWHQAGGGVFSMPEPHLADEDA